MRLSRRQLLQASAVGGAALAAPGALAFAPAVPGAASGGRSLASAAPESGFERTGDWTTHEDELAFLDEVVAGAVNPLTLDVIGTTAQGRPLHQVTIGLGATQNGTPRTMPTVLVLGSQHGNEPAGREASLKLLRDLAFADLTAEENADLATVLADQTVLVVPSANPDGRARNSRANSNGFDINRDHLRLSTEEARAFADVINEWAPYMALDLHEYGPSTPVVYDDDLLYLWSRNLNVDEEVRSLAIEYCLDYLKADCEAAGYTADEYGLQKVGPNVGSVQTPLPGAPQEASVQTAGGGDPGICRNATGLRHTIGILVESAVTQSPFRTEELASSEANLRRRVESQRVLLDSMLRFALEKGEQANATTIAASSRKAVEGRDGSAPVYFAGQDDARPQQSDSESSVAGDTVPGYLLSDAALDAPGYELENGRDGNRREAVLRALEGQAIVTEERPDGLYVPVAQAAEPLIPLLFDQRAPANRRLTDLAPSE